VQPRTRAAGRHGDAVGGVRDLRHRRVVDDAAALTLDRACQRASPPGAPEPSTGPGASSGSGSQPQPQPQPQPKPPALSRVKLAKSFRSASGTRLTFTLDRAASLKIALTRAVTGHRKGRKCVTRPGRGAKCVRKVAAGRLTLSAKAGPNALVFGRRLKRGRYTATVTAVADGAASAPARIAFVVR
jgi:hypothetical protein